MTGNDILQYNHLLSAVWVLSFTLYIAFRFKVHFVLYCSRVYDFPPAASISH